MQLKTKKIQTQTQRYIDEIKDLIFIIGTIDNGSEKIIAQILSKALIKIERTV